MSKRPRPIPWRDNRITAPPKVTQTFEEFLDDAERSGFIDFHMRIIRTPQGLLDFYIHPDGMDGETADFHVSGGFVTRLNVGAGSDRPTVKIVGSGE